MTVFLFDRRWMFDIGSVSKSSILQKNPSWKAQGFERKTYKLELRLVYIFGEGRMGCRVDVWPFFLQNMFM